MSDRRYQTNQTNQTSFISRHIHTRAQGQAHTDKRQRQRTATVPKRRALINRVKTSTLAVLGFLKLLACKSGRIALAAVVYGITVYITTTATDRHTFLGSVSPAIGVWVLNILSKLTGAAFVFFADGIWQKLQWTLLSKNRALNLSVFFALSSTTDAKGSWDILTHGWRQWFRSKKGTKDEDLDLNLSRGRGWSFGRILVALCLLVPGIIITADINTKTLYFPIEHHQISGGIGYYHSSYATIFQGFPGASISSLVQSLLKDTTIAHSVDPISPECKTAGLSCQSHLIPGGLKTVSPWPFPKFADQSITAFEAKQAPAYQIDFWDGPENISWAPSDCHIYGEFGHNYHAFQLCIAEYPNKPGHLASAWRVCPTEVIGSGECNQTNSWAGSQTWTTSMVIYRRLATVTCSRNYSTILDVKDLGEPVKQTKSQGMSPKDIFVALDTFIYRAEGSNMPSECKTDASSWQLYNHIGSQLYLLRAQQAQALSLPLDLLRNTLVTPLYLYNDLALGIGPITLALDSAQPGLPSENYVEGSYITTSTRSIPGAWTVWAYLGAGAAILLVGFIAQLYLIRSDTPTLSGNPLIDFIILTESCDESLVSGKDGWTSATFVNPDLSYKKENLLDTVAHIHVAIKRESD